MSCTNNPNYNTHRVAIFDIDNTLTIYESKDFKCDNALRDFQPVWPSGLSGTTQTVVDVFSECDKNNFYIAIATAETGDNAYAEKQRQFIYSIAEKAGLHKRANVPFNGMVGTKEWMSTPLFQNSCSVLGYNKNNYCDSIYCRKEPCEFSVSKIPHYINILNYLEIPPTRYHQSIVFDDSVQNLYDAHTLGLQTTQASLSCGGVECQRACGIEPGSIELIRNQPRLSPAGNGSYLGTQSYYHPDQCSK